MYSKGILFEDSEEEIIIHSVKSNVNTERIEGYLKGERTDGSVAVMRSGDFYTVNLHAGQTNASGHSKNLRGSSTAGPATYTHVTKLFQRIRDESHRFAVSHHTVLKRTKQTASSLEDIPGIGPATRRTLIRKFGSLRGVSAASHDELSQVVGTKRAKDIYAYLHVK